MRVALSMLNLVPGEIGGAERYAIELARALPAAGTDACSLVPEGAGDALAGTSVVVSGRPGGSWGAKLRRAAAALLPPRPVRRLLSEADVVHYPLTMPLPPTRTPWVTTLHDLQHRELPQLFSRARRAYRSVAYDGAARRADAVVVPTAHARERAVELLGLAPGKVHAIAHGVDHALFRPGHETREPFLLYPAHAWPHKNHARLFAAFGLLQAERPELELVLTGGGDLPAPVPLGVRLLGRVPDDELAALYRRASCLVFPSLYEGFGMPPLEAMACGCPVAASRIGPLAEVCADAAVLFDPSDPAAIAAGVLDALGRAEQLSRRGLARAAEFTWERTAQAHTVVYHSVA
jgi:glycosyltransferase involved in cell wall biosynthesis